MAADLTGALSKIESAYDALTTLLATEAANATTDVNIDSLDPSTKDNLEKTLKLLRTIREELAATGSNQVNESFCQFTQVIAQ